MYNITNRFQTILFALYCFMTYALSISHSKTPHLAAFMSRKIVLRTAQPRRNPGDIATARKFRKRRSPSFRNDLVA
jgi:hypothetical protein